jgi:hypothetical protein
MRALTAAGACATLLLVFAPASSGQWPAFPDQNVPRLPSGEADMNAPTPRMPDGRPDFSGVWENIRPIAGGPDEPKVSLDEVGRSSFRDLGGGFVDGLPLTPWAKELKDKRMAAHSRDNPDVWCLPMGNSQLNNHTFPRKMIQTADVLLILYETHQGIRQIFLDGRPLPDNDPQPWWYGYSVGRWEGDTLIVESTNYRDGEWLDINGSPLTDQGRTIERFRRLNTGTLQIDVTVIDPKAYTRPFTVRLEQRYMPDNEIIEMICLENNRSLEHLVPPLP